jgi:hypothetical protein
MGWWCPELSYHEREINLQNEDARSFRDCRKQKLESDAAHRICANGAVTELMYPEQEHILTFGWEKAKQKLDLQECLVPTLRSSC